MAEHEEDKGFVVHDHRRFTGAGDTRPEAISSHSGGEESPGDEGVPPPGAARTAYDAMRDGPRGPSPEEQADHAAGSHVGGERDGEGARAGSAESSARAGSSPGKEPGSPPIDFTTFVFSLGSSALIHLGDAPHPETGEAHRDLALARETIDLLAMLRDKTRGNLSSEEERFLGSLLYDLRMRFIEAAKQ